MLEQQYLARPNFRLCQCVDGGDVAAVKRASSGAYSITFILYSSGRKSQYLLVGFLQHKSEYILFEVKKKKKKYKRREGIFLKDLVRGAEISLTKDIFLFGTILKVGRAKLVTRAHKILPLGTS